MTVPPVSNQRQRNCSCADRLTRFKLELTEVAIFLHVRLVWFPAHMDWERRKRGLGNTRQTANTDVCNTVSRSPRVCGQSRFSGRSHITTPTGTIPDAYNGYLRIPDPQRCSFPLFSQQSSLYLVTVYKLHHSTYFMLVLLLLPSCYWRN